MTERPSAETILRLKDELVQLWQQLPIEHQATMLLVLMKDLTRDTHYKAWLLEVFPLLYSPKNDETTE
jgi:hypothetical protein